MIEKLFIEVSAISKRYEDFAKITGENFNVFQILGVQSNEVRLHSAFLAELLNPKGSHGQGDVYLTLFLKQIELFDFDTTSAEAFVEYYSGKITDDSEYGGRIDILLEDKNRKHVIIENKIYADDQKKQLKRYKNFDKDAELLYLNLTGVEPTDDSISDLILDTDFRIISYKNEILKWLNACLKESTTLPIVRETIHQYINLIKRLTNQTTFTAMSNEIKKLLCEKPEYFNGVPAINSAFEELKTEILKKFFDLLGEKMINEKFEADIYEEDLQIQLQAGEDGGGLYFAYRLAKKNNQVRCNLSKKNITNAIVINEPKNAIFEKYSSLITSLIKDSKHSSWSLRWYNPTPFKGGKRLCQLDYSLYVSLLDTVKCNNFIDTLLNDEIDFFKRLKQEINK